MWVAVSVCSWVDSVATAAAAALSWPQEEHFGSSAQGQSSAQCRHV